MYGVTRAPFNSNRSSCGIEVVVPLFSHPKFETPSEIFRSNAHRPTYGARQADGNDPAGDIYPRPDRNSLDAGEPPSRSMNFKILKVRSRASCGLEILSSLLATACEVSE